jgi:hypothetical protein
MRHRLALVTAAGMLMAIVMVARLTNTQTKDAQMTVQFCGYTDYWMVDPPTRISLSSTIHFPREARFTVQNHSARSVVSIWPDSRLQFRGPATNTQVIPQMHATLGPTAAVPISVALRGAEHGEWRLLVPVSDLRFEIWIEKVIGRGLVSGFVKGHLKAHPKWIASDWIPELPHRTLHPPSSVQGSGWVSAIGPVLIPVPPSPSKRNIAAPDAY